MSSEHRERDEWAESMHDEDSILDIVEERGLAWVLRAVAGACIDLGSMHDDEPDASHRLRDMCKRLKALAAIAERS
jgi:hypothetical protein